MSNSLSSAAISAAINSSWDQAVILNKKILQENPSDVAALNRLAYAFFEQGHVRKAQQFYRKVLSFDPYNPIALKNLQRVREFHSLRPNHNIRTPLPTSIFLEEPGKTKVINLVKIAAKSILSQLRPGDPLVFSPRKHTIALFDVQKNYVGSLPDDLSFRLLKFIHGGNQYEAYVRSVTKNSLLIFLREVYRSQRFKHTPSFLSHFECYHGTPLSSAKEEPSLPDEVLTSSPAGEYTSNDDS